MTFSCNLGEISTPTGSCNFSLVLLIYSKLHSKSLQSFDYLYQMHCAYFIDDNQEIQETFCCYISVLLYTIFRSFFHR